MVDKDSKHAHILDQIIPLPEILLRNKFKTKENAFVWRYYSQ